MITYIKGRCFSLNFSLFRNPFSLTRECLFGRYDVNKVSLLMRNKISYYIQFLLTPLLKVNPVISSFNIITIIDIDIIFLLGLAITYILIGSNRWVSCMKRDILACFLGLWPSGNSLYNSIAL